MDMDVLFKPPMLYLVLVMTSWGVGLVPRLIEGKRHRLVWLSSLLHLAAYGALLHDAVPLESCSRILAAAFEVTFLLTLGGYLLHWFSCHVGVGCVLSLPDTPIGKRQGSRS